MINIRSMLAALALACCCISLASCAQRTSDTHTVRLEKAFDALADDDYDTALSLIDEQLEETPGNANALLLKARVEYARDEYGNALRDIRRAESCNRYGSTGIYRSTFSWWRFRIYEAMGRMDEALPAIERTNRLAKRERRDADDMQDIRFDLADTYYALRMYDDADDIYHLMLKADEADVSALTGLARNCFRRGMHEEAVAYAQAAIDLDSEYSSPYKFLMQAYDAMGERRKAADAAISFVRNDDDYPFEYAAVTLAKAPAYSEAQIRSRMSDDDWFGYRFLLASLFDATRDHLSEACVWTSLIDEYGEDADLLVSRGDAFGELGFFELSVEDFRRAVELDPGMYNLLSLAYAYKNVGDYAEAVDVASAALDKDPSHGVLWYFRGWMKELLGDDEGAFEDFDRGCDVDEDYCYSFLKRAEHYVRMGEREKADADLEYLVQKDTVVRDASVIQYALHMLGRDDEALGWMDRIIEDDPDYSGNWYDRACLLSLMGRSDDALSAFRTAVDKGFRRWRHACDDSDLDPIRGMPGFEEIMKDIRGRIAKDLAGYNGGHHEVAAVVREEGTTEVRMRKQYGGTYEVPCSINGLALNMVFDTGASDVTISSLEAGFMLKNGYLSEKDVKGSRSYMTASGDVKEGTVIRLKEVRLGDSVLRDIDASVVHNQKAPLLLGESVLQRFGTFTVDNTSSRLIIRY